MNWRMLRSKLKPGTYCLYELADPEKPDLGRYYRLHEDGKGLIDSWFRRACSKTGCVAEESFEPFIFCWIAFNAWASCVTGEDRDLDMIMASANCPELRESFRELYAGNGSFRLALDSFSKLWPIFRAQDISRLPYTRMANKERAEIIEYYFSFPRVRFAPACCRYHSEAKNEPVPPDWPHTITAIYQVRCNLFHGEKTPHSEMDARIVKGAFDVLVTFLREGGIITAEEPRKSLEEEEED